LVGFEKVWLKPGEKRLVAMSIDPAAPNHPFGVFDSATQKWKTPGGTYRLMLGTSSADIKLSAPLEIPGS
jgi:beta-glucosidase